MAADTDATVFNTSVWHGRCCVQQIHKWWCPKWKAVSWHRCCSVLPETLTDVVSEMRTGVCHWSCSVWHESHSVWHKSCNTDAVVFDMKAPMSDTEAAVSDMKATVSDLKATVSDTKVVVSDMRATVSDTEVLVSDTKASLWHWSCSVWHDSHSLWHQSWSVWHERHSIWHWRCSIWYESMEYLILTRNSSVLTFLPLSVVDWLPTPLESSGYQYQWLNFCKKIQDSELFL